VSQGGAPSDLRILLAGREILFEFTQFGLSMRVCAVDAETGTEVVVTTPVNAARADQERLALRKLARALGLAG
jgi:hypothetical protein